MKVNFVRQYIPMYLHWFKGVVLDYNLLYSVWNPYLKEILLEFWDLQYCLNSQEEEMAKNDLFHCINYSIIYR